MFDFLDAFAAVFLFPLDPANLNLDSNVIMIGILAVLVPMGIARCLRGILSCFM